MLYIERHFGLCPSETLVAVLSFGRHVRSCVLRPTVTAGSAEKVPCHLWPLSEPQLMLSQLALVNHSHFPDIPVREYAKVREGV